MSQSAILDDVLRCVAQENSGAAMQRLPPPGPDPDAQAWSAAVADFVAFMGPEGPLLPRTEPFVDDAEVGVTTRLLAAAIHMLVASLDADVDDSAAAALIAPLNERALADPGARGGRQLAFARYVAQEAALSTARVSIAQEVAVAGPAPDACWSGHPFAAVMTAARARTEVFVGRIDEALGLIASCHGAGAVEHVVRATEALARAHAGDERAVARLVAAADAAGFASIDRLGQTAGLLFAYALIVTGDPRAAGRLDLAASAGPPLRLVDRAFHLELMVAVSVAAGDAEAARAWYARGDGWVNNRITQPSDLRMQVRLSLLEGTPDDTLKVARDAAEAATAESRVGENLEAEMLLARASIESSRLTEAAHRLRALVAEGDDRGHLAVRVAASKELRGTRRRLPPQRGRGWSALSGQERAVAELIVAGLETEQIAGDLHLSAATVRAHTSRVLTAFRVASRTALLPAVHDPVTLDAAATSDLTPRQGEVAALVARGLTNTAIAQELQITAKSVESHVSAILQRWSVRSRFELAHRWWSLAQSSTPLAPTATDS